MGKETVLVSACLLGVRCRYDGGDAYCRGAVELLGKFDLIPFCPELLGGMPVPRDPVEIAGGRVKTADGEDKTAQFAAGAVKSLELARKFKVGKAFLKSGSPSCGCDFIHDGTFSGKLIAGKGFTAALFIENGIKTFSERDIPEGYKKI